MEILFKTYPVHNSFNKKLWSDKYKAESTEEATYTALK